MMREPALSRSVDSHQARRKELAQIHIAVADLGWNEDHYRHVLQAKTGVRSASDLDSTGRKRFIDHLKACGWSGGKKLAGPRYTRQQWHALMLWRDLGKAGALEDKSEAALNAFIKGHVGVDSIRFLDVAAATSVIEALKSWLKRSRQAR